MNEQEHKDQRERLIQSLAAGEPVLGEGLDEGQPEKALAAEELTKGQEDAEQVQALLTDAARREERIVKRYSDPELPPDPAVVAARLGFERAQAEMDATRGAQKTSPPRFYAPLVALLVAALALLVFQPWKTSEDLDLPEEHITLGEGKAGELPIEVVLDGEGFPRSLVFAPRISLGSFDGTVLLLSGNVGENWRSQTPLLIDREVYSTSWTFPPDPKLRLSSGLTIVVVLNAVNGGPELVYGRIFVE